MRKNDTEKVTIVMHKGNMDETANMLKTYAMSVLMRFVAKVRDAEMLEDGNTVILTMPMNDDNPEWVQNNILKKYSNYKFPEEQLAGAGKVPLQVVSYDGNGEAGVGEAWNYVYQTNFYYVDNRGNKKPLTGYNLRNALGLRSHAFRVEYEASTDEVVITTQGWGHGVGFSQMGAVGYANEEGWSYVKILRHYFSVTGTSNHQVVMPVW